MNKKIKNLIIFIIAIVSQAIIAFLCENYIGVPFQYDLIAIIFNIISFSCLTTICKTDSKCLFCNESIAVRFKNRKGIIFQEMKKRICYVGIFVLVNNAVILLIQKTNIINFIYMIVFEFLAYLFIAVFQICLELKFSSDIGYLSIIISYISLLFAGIIVFNYCNEFNNSLSTILKAVNNLNIVNYLSLNRIQLLECNYILIIFTLIGIDVFALFVIPLALKRVDIIERK